MEREEKGNRKGERRASGVGIKQKTMNKEGKKERKENYKQGNKSQNRDKTKARK